MKTMKAKKIAIYGGGGFAREVAWLVQSCNEEEELYEIACFIDDDEAKQGTELNGIPVLGLESAYHNFPDARVIGGVGVPKTRQRIMERAAEIGFGYETIIHPRVEMSKWIEIGIGTLICAGNILTTNIKLGKHVQINLDCTIGHDVLMGDFATLAPGVHVSGWVHLGKRVYGGTGAVIINGTEHSPIKIGDDAIIGAGACVTQSVPKNTMVAGIPAKVIKKLDDNST